MRFFFILPDEYASVSCPLSRRTRNRASGRSSMTVPSNSIRSSFAKECSFVVETSRLEPRKKGAPKRPFDDRRLGRTQVDSRDPAALSLFELEAQLLSFLQ